MSKSTFLTNRYSRFPVVVFITKVWLSGCRWHTLHYSNIAAKYIQNIAFDKSSLRFFANFFFKFPAFQPQKSKQLLENKSPPLF